MKGTKEEPLKSFSKARIYTYYDIKYFKADRNKPTNDNPRKLRKMGAAMSEVIGALAEEEGLFPRDSLLIPVPNYDVAEDHASQIARTAVSPFEVREVLKCIKDTKNKGLSRDGRWTAREDAYEAVTDLSGLNVILVDDLLTTGSTFHGAALACRTRGASRVFGVTVARLIEPELKESYIDGLVFRTRSWLPLANSAIFKPGNENAALRVRFNCRHCPGQVTSEAMEWPVTDQAIDCPRCSHRYSFSLEANNDGFLRATMSECRRADLYISIEANDGGR
jgi:DNA-directed RNA polymerase subunit RPC12/RpoP